MNSDLDIGELVWSCKEKSSIMMLNDKLSTDSKDLKLLFVFQNSLAKALIILFAWFLSTGSLTTLKSFLSETIKLALLKEMTFIISSKILQKKLTGSLISSPRVTGFTLESYKNFEISLESCETTPKTIKSAKPLKGFLSKIFKMISIIFSDFSVMIPARYSPILSHFLIFFFFSENEETGLGKAFFAVMS